MDFTAESIGIVAPVYGHEVPSIVKEFMEKAAFHTDYFYMVLTYGNRHGGAAELAERFCRTYLIQVRTECIGCGVCARVCPSGSIQIKEGKAVHHPERCLSFKGKIER